MNIVMLGAPGTGKGTAAKMLAKKLNLPHISTGDMFREEIKNATELGKKAQEYIDKGNLVPDEITINMLKGKINQFKDSNGVVFDGFPRNKKQAEALEEMLEDFDLDPTEVFWILIKLGHIDMELFDNLYGNSYE